MKGSKSDEPRGVAIVTGAARRVGRHIALGLAKQLHFDVVVHYNTSIDAANDTVAQILAAGSRAVAVSADLQQPATAARTIFDTAAKLGPVSVLVNCASVFEDCPLDDVSLSHCESHFAVNTFAPTFLIQELHRQLKHDRGHVINILDWRALRPPGTHLVYTASRAAVASMTKTLALQLAPALQVNAVAPGAVLPADDDAEDHAARAANQIPLGQAGNPDDVFRAVRYLLESPFVTGDVLCVSGGEEL